jgi:DNA polymerase-3 subunit beta
MKAILTKKNLLQGICTASHAIDARALMPVLRHVHLSSVEGLTEEETWIRFSGTDLETGISTVIPAQVLTPGEVTLPASVAAEIVGLLPDGSVTLERDGSLIRLSSPPAEFSLVGLPPDEFPDLPEVPEDVWFEMDTGQLRAALRRTVFACSADELRVVLRGVLFDFEGDTLKLVATDTFRLAVDTRSVFAPAGSGQARVVVPQRALLELLKIMPDRGTVRVYISERQILFCLPEATLVAALIEGQFPDYERVIPTDFDGRWVIPTELLAGALRRAQVVARQDMHRVVLRSRGEKVAISARAGDVGEAYDEVDAVREGDDLEIAFNCGYLLDVLNVLEADEVTFEMSGALSPAVLRPVGQEGYLCVVMPMEKGEEEEA